MTSHRSILQERYAFLFLSFLIHCNSFAQDEPLSPPYSSSFEFNQTSQSNAGILLSSYWGNQNLSNNTHSIVAKSEDSIKASINFASTDISVERHKSYTYVGSSNALILTANNNKFTSTGTFSVDGKYSFYDFNSLNINLKNIFNSEKYDFSLSPQLIGLHSFQTNQGRGILSNSINFSTLVGSLRKQGVNSYGFLSNADDLDLGYGYSINSHFLLHQPQYDFQINLQNITSSIFATNYFFSNMNVNATQVGQSFTFNKIPSITGAYGQSSIRLRLPTYTDITINSHQNPSIALVIIGIDSNYYSLLRTEWRKDNFQTAIELDAMNNISIFISKHDAFLHNLSVSIAILKATDSKPFSLIAQTKYIF